MPTPPNLPRRAPALLLAGRKISSRREPERLAWQANEAACDYQRLGADVFAEEDENSVIL